MSEFNSLRQAHQKVSGDNLAFVKYYEENKTEIDSLDHDIKEQRDFKLTMHGNYGLSLADNGYPEKAISVLDAFIPRFEKESGLTAQELLTTPYYEHLLWSYGLSLFNVNRLKESEVVFVKLISLRPDNQKYKSWVKGVIGKRFQRTKNALYMILMVFMVVSLIWGKSLEPDAQFLLACFGSLTLVTTLSLEVYLYFTKKRIG